MSTQPLVGQGAFLGMGEEVTYGTAVAITHWVLVASMGLKRDIKRKPVTTLGKYGDAFAAARSTYIEADEAGGPITLPFGYDGGHALLLKHLFGAVSTSGTGPFTHEYTLTANGPSDPGLTLEQNSGQSGPAARAEQFSGGKFGSWEIDIQVGKEVMLSVDTIARTSGGPAVASSPTFAAVSTALHQHFTSLTFNAAAIAGLIGVKVKFDRAQARRQELGSSYTAEPYQDGEGSVMVECRYRITDNALLTAYLAGTQAAGALVLSDGTNSFTLDFGAMVLEKVDRPVSGRGAIEATATFRCLATDDIPGGCKATLVCGDATPEATA